MSDLRNLLVSNIDLVVQVIHSVQVEVQEGSMAVGIRMSHDLAVHCDPSFHSLNKVFDLKDTNFNQPALNQVSTSENVRLHRLDESSLEFSQDLELVAIALESE